MKVISTIKQLRAELEKERQEAKTIGLVPTMGYFHDGHLELMRKARDECDVVVVSLYVNPTQFAPTEDFEDYPRDPKRDLQLAEDAGVDYLFRPSNEEMYLPEHLTFVEVEEMTKKLCGASRQHHFRGVTTIVAKLFNIAQPDRAYFGQKDSQQVAVIKKMVGDLNFNLDVVVVPTVREKDGLAMSSRNTYLSVTEREDAKVISESLQYAKKLIDSGERSAQTIRSEMAGLVRSKPLVNLEYISICDNETLEELSKVDAETLIALAAKVGKARLIDNIVIKV